MSLYVKFLRTRNLALLAVGFSLLTSCATIIKPVFRASRVRVLSEPQGAAVVIEKTTICKTPCDIEPNRNKSTYDVNIELEGYKTQTITIREGIYWGFWVNFMFTIYAPIPMGIDYLTGAMWRFKPKQISRLYAK